MELSLTNNTTITVEGFVTDPKSVGFQVLTNYENMFWRALVGSNPWSLYEVLRGYCHGDNSSCHPSIATLMAILGVKDRRSLTGYAQRKNGKKYLGWIEILQTYELIIAEVKGEGSSLHYLFHVNLTPQLLKDKQLATLPDVLQQKHQELLEKCEHQLERLRSRRKPAKTAREASQSVSKEVKGRLGKSHAPPGTIPPSPGTIPPKQQPSNNTHKQTTTNAAVAGLKKWNFPHPVAQQLVNEFGSERVQEKLAYLDFKLNDLNERVKNPAGWLRTAIQQHWSAPAGYKTPEQRLAETQHAQAQTEQQEQVVCKQRQQRTQQQKQSDSDYQQQLIALRQQYHTPERLTDRWKEIQLTLQHALNAAQWALVSKSALLQQDAHGAVICVPSAFTCQLLANQPAIHEAIAAALSLHSEERQVEITVISPAQTASAVTHPSSVSTPS